MVDNAERVWFPGEEGVTARVGVSGADVGVALFEVLV